jgi:hypothetical protein
MYYIKPFFVERKETTSDTGTTIVGKNYSCYCPFCGDKNLEWPNDYEERKGDATNKCKHFFGISKDGKFVFKSKPTVKIVDGLVYIDGVNTYYKNVSELIDKLITTMEFYNGYWNGYTYPKFLTPLKCMSNSYAYGDAIKTDRVEMILEALKKKLTSKPK